MRLLAIDPGSSKAAVSHTGIVLLDVPADAPPTLVDSWAVPSGVTGFREWYLEDDSPERCEALDFADVVVCEMFVNRNIPGADLSPLLIEGVVRYIWPDVVLQPAAGKNSSVPDAALNRLGFNKKSFGGDHHADRWEALRHAVWYLKKQRHLPTLRAGWPPA